MEVFTEYLRQARRNAIGLFNLGMIYIEGKNVEQDYVLAYVYFSLAADLGDKDASEKCDEIAECMTPEQIAKAEKMTKEMIEKIAKNKQKKS